MALRAPPSGADTVLPARRRALSLVPPPIPACDPARNREPGAGQRLPGHRDPSHPAGGVHRRHRQDCCRDADPAPLRYTESENPISVPRSVNGMSLCHLSCGVSGRCCPGTFDAATVNGSGGAGQEQSCKHYSPRTCISGWPVSTHHGHALRFLHGEFEFQVKVWSLRMLLRLRFPRASCARCPGGNRCRSLPPRARSGAASWRGFVAPPAPSPR